MHQQRPSGSKGVMSRHLRPSGGSSSNRTRSYVKRRFSYPKPSPLTQRDAADGKLGTKADSARFRKRLPSGSYALPLFSVPLLLEPQKGE